MANLVAALASASNAQSLYPTVAESRFAADGRQVLADLGNTYGSIVSYRYEDGTKRLTNVALDRQGVTGTDVNLNYAYDAAGNMVSIKDQPTAAGVSGAAFQDNQCFSFDGLRRLQTAFTAVAGDCAVAQDGVSLSEVGGVSPYWTDYSYDLLSNRTQLVQHGTGGATSDATTTYSHGAGAAGPHQVTSVAKTQAATTTTSAYTYDAAGNRATASTGAASTSYLWDAEGELTGVNAERYTYDASGSRLLRKDASGTTIYLPGGQEITIAASTVTASRYYSFAGQTVAVRTGGGLGAVSSLVSDMHGSVVASVPNTAAPTTTAVQRMFSDPFGAQRSGSSASIPGDHRFLGAVRDAGSGLTLLGARYYDEAVGQFISVDPLLDAGEPAQFNAYSYSFNNPVTFSDPSGMVPGKGVGTSSKKKKPTTPATGTSPSSPTTKSAPSVEDVSGYAYDALSTWLASDEARTFYEVGNSNSGLLNDQLSLAMDDHDGKGAYALFFLLLNSRGYEGGQVLAMAYSLRDIFQDKGEWDLKPGLAAEFDLKGIDTVGDDTSGRVRSDVFGNVNYGAMMALFGVREDVALRASNLGTDATGRSDSLDDGAISLGYQMVQQHPDGITRDQYLAMILGAVSSDGTIHPPIPAWVQG